MKTILILLLVISILPIGITQYLLFDAFGYDITQWTTEQKATAESFLHCIDTITNASTNPSEIRIALRCWELTK